MCNAPKTAARGFRLTKLWPCQPLDWDYPESWAMVASFGAWLVVAASQGAMGGATHAAHLLDHSAALGSSPEDLLQRWLRLMISGAVMVAAMMPPLVISQIRFTAMRSLWQRRQRAVAGFLLGYLGVWLVAMNVTALPIAFLSSTTGGHTPIVAALAFVSAGVWQLTPAKKVGLRGCHRTLPLAPTGWRADRDCLRYGYVVARSCLVTCWPLMLACALTGHDVVPMLSASGVAIGERLVFRPNQRLLATLLIYTGGLYWLGLI